MRIYNSKIDFDINITDQSIVNECRSIFRSKPRIPVDTEKLAKVEEFIEYAVTENRMDQAISEVFGDEPIVIQKIGEYFKWLMKDISDEESDTLEKNGWTMKDVNKVATNKAKKYFMEKLG